MGRLVVVAMIALAAAVLGATRLEAADPSASVPTAPTGLWQGIASEAPSTYTSTGKATIALDLRPDGTFTETWTQRGVKRQESGRWHVSGRDIVLQTTEPTSERLRLRRLGDTLYTVAQQPLPAEGRVATEAIELHPAPR